MMVGDNSDEPTEKLFWHKKIKGQKKNTKHLKVITFGEKKKNFIFPDSERQRKKEEFEELGNEGEERETRRAVLKPQLI